MRPKVRSSTIVGVRHGGKVALAGDGQVAVGRSIMKTDARKVRALAEGKVIVAFAGSAGDAAALLERLEKKLEDAPGRLRKAAVALAKEWRTDEALRRLDALLAVADASALLLVSASGDVIEPDDGVLGIGAGGAYAAAAARALVRHARHLAAATIAEEALHIAAESCIDTNDHVTVLTIDCAEPAAGGAGTGL
jgi:ATP-dependent HslUV protease subunit HslV